MIDESSTGSLLFKYYNASHDEKENLTPKVFNFNNTVRFLKRECKYWISGFARTCVKCK